MCRKCDVKISNLRILLSFPWILPCKDIDECTYDDSQICDDKPKIHTLEYFVPSVEAHKEIRNQVFMLITFTGLLRE